MTGTSPRRGRLAAALAGAATLAAMALVPVPAAVAASGVTVSSDLGANTVDAEYATNITVSGSGFQTVQGGFGGIYVLFGWAGDGWRPSQGGAIGRDYLYIPDSESKNNNGFQSFVSFPGSDTEGAAQAVMGADGSWSVDMIVPGPTFEAQDRNGDVTEVDCLEKRCGIMTIGAHGVVNPQNETFTPVDFVVPDGQEQQAAGGQAPDDRAGSASTGDTDGKKTGKTSEAEPAAAVGQLSIGVTAQTLTAGDALSFTARGFAPGEQVVASLDGGVAAVGPLAAGASGEVAGVLSLPADLAAGTHLLTVSGAGTEGVVETEITVAANAVSGAAGFEQDAPAWLLIAMVIVVALAAALVIANVVVAIVRGVRSRRARAAA